ncbi:unnamed protein product [Closterium sp. NIES-54]
MQTNYNISYLHIFPLSLSHLQHPPPHPQRPDPHLEHPLLQRPSPHLQRPTHRAHSPPLSAPLSHPKRLPPSREAVSLWGSLPALLWLL